MTFNKKTSHNDWFNTVVEKLFVKKLSPCPLIAARHSIRQMKIHTAYTTYPSGITAPFLVTITPSLMV